MSDERLRVLERAAAGGDEEAGKRLGEELCRVGRHEPEEGKVYIHQSENGDRRLSATCSRCGWPFDLTDALTVVRQEVVRRLGQVAMDILTGGMRIEPWAGNTGQGIVYPPTPPREARPGDGARGRIFS